MTSENGEKYPIAVQNLRKIWIAKKHEAQTTQNEAAKELGWTQGAFAQYLNNLTDLNPQAIIKLANFLGVAPTDIDPDINKELPSETSIKVRYDLDDATSQIQNVKSNLPSDGFFIVLKRSITIPMGDDVMYLPSGARILCRDADATRSSKVNATDQLYLIQKRNATKFQLINFTELLDLDTKPIKRFLVSAIFLS
jgi:transcriptional regulator with XRE-family HTH domain